MGTLFTFWERVIHYRSERLVFVGGKRRGGAKAHFHTARPLCVASLATASLTIGTDHYRSGFPGQGTLYVGLHNYYYTTVFFYIYIHMYIHMLIYKYMYEHIRIYIYILHRLHQSIIWHIVLQYHI